MIQHFFSLFAAMDILEISRSLIVFFVPFLFSLCFHEYAHGWVARLRGDRTAEMMGRLSMNPLVHADPIGTFLLPIMTVLLHSPIGFGWAKPVPVNSRNLKNPRTDMFWVALAGPVSNVFLAVLSAFVLAFCDKFLFGATYYKGIIELVQAMIVLNLFLAFFNLIPINPLDGGKILARFLSPSLNQKLEQYETYSSIILFALIMLGALHFLSIPVMATANWMIRFALGVVS